MSAKKQIDFVREKGGSIFEEPVVRLANLLEIENNSKDRNGNGSFSFHLVMGPEASIPEDQVDSIGNIYQVVDSRDLSMHAVEIGWLQSERTQVSELFDGLDFMVVLRHVIGLPLRFWHRHRIVAGRWCRPTLCGVVR